MMMEGRGWLTGEKIAAGNLSLRYSTGYKFQKKGRLSRCKARNVAKLAVKCWEWGWLVTFS